MPIDQPVKVNAVVSFDDKTVADSKAENDRNYASQKSIRNATWSAVVAAAVYALISLGIWFSMSHQNDLIKSQWEKQNRAWIGLSEDLELTKQPKFEAMTGRKVTGIDIDMSLRIKNFGVSPAFGTEPATEVILSSQNILKLPEMKGACSLADHPSEIEGSVIFPGRDNTFNRTTQTYIPITLGEVRRIWILGCIAYRDGMSPSIHHTKFWIVSFLIPEGSSPTVTGSRTDRTFYTVDIAGWQLMKTEAD